MPSPSSPAEPLPDLDTLRARYQKGLLAWLQAPESGAGLAPMTAALAALPPHPLWDAALTLLQTIQEGRLPPRVEYRRLAGRVDQALRKASASQPPDATLLPELQAPLAQLDPPPQAPMEALVPRSPLAPTLAATAAILPLMAQSREPRFSGEQRQAWDGAAPLLLETWARRSADWGPLRRAVFKLLEGALPLGHPAPLRLAEALACATDQLESTPPGPRLLAALSATLELLAEPDFLEHPAMEQRVAQLVPRLEGADDSGPSVTLETLFAQEALECVEHLHQALEAVPPDLEALAQGLAQLREAAEHGERAEIANWAARLDALLPHFLPQQLDYGTGRVLVQQFVASLEEWISSGTAVRQETASAIDLALERLAASLPG